MEEKTAYEGYAIVELMGRNVIAGYVSEQTIAGVAMLRIDVPAVGEIEKYTKFVSGGAIYGITPTTQEIAAARRSAPAGATGVAVRRASAGAAACPRRQHCAGWQ